MLQAASITTDGSRAQRSRAQRCRAAEMADRPHAGFRNLDRRPLRQHARRRRPGGGHGDRFDGLCPLLRRPDPLSRSSTRWCSRRSVRTRSPIGRSWCAAPRRSRCAWSSGPTRRPRSRATACRSASCCPATSSPSRPADNNVTLLHPADHDYYRILRSKLRWGRGDRARARSNHGLIATCSRISRFATSRSSTPSSSSSVAGLTVLTGETGAGKSILSMRCCSPPADAPAPKSIRARRRASRGVGHLRPARQRPPRSPGSRSNPSSTRTNACCAAWSAPTDGRGRM